MREIRIYQDEEFSEGKIIKLNEAAAKHVATVLRLSLHNKITLFANNFECVAEIVELSKKNVLVKLSQSKYVSRESFRKIHLACALSKGERMEFIIQKATELGVTSLTPLETTRSQVKLNPERKLKRASNWEGIVISASEQCGRNTLMQINPFMAFADFINANKEGYKFILSLKDAKSWKDYPINDNKDITIITGCEGGFTEEELHLAATQYKALSFGNRVLRAETAAIAAVSVFQAIAGDLN